MTDGPTGCGRCLAEDTDADLQCDTPTDIARDRLALRATSGTDVSDATGTVATGIARTADAWPSAVTIDTSTSLVASTVAAVAMPAPAHDARPMRAWVIDQPGPIDTGPLLATTRTVPEPADRELRMRVPTSGVCRTDLHLTEGDLVPTVAIDAAHGTQSGFESTVVALNAVVRALVGVVKRGHAKRRWRSDTAYRHNRDDAR